MDQGGLWQEKIFTVVVTNVAEVLIVQSGGSTQVTEGGATDRYTVVLDTPPTANVVIAISPDAQVSVTPISLTFTSANWNIAQTVTVTAVDDAVAEGTHTGVIAPHGGQQRRELQR